MPEHECVIECAAEGKPWLCLTCQEAVDKARRDERVGMAVAIAFGVGLVLSLIVQVSMLLGLSMTGQL